MLTYRYRSLQRDVVSWLKNWKGKRLLLYSALIVAIIILSFPYCWMFLTSIRPESELYKAPPLFFPRGLALESYFSVWRIAEFGVYFINSTIVAIAVVTITVFVATLGAYALSRFRYPFEGSLFRFILFIYMVPPILFSLPLFVFMAKIGLNDTLLGLILIQLTMTFPISLWILVGFFQAIPIELEESALLDGASRLQSFLRIVLPLASPGIMAISLFTFVTSWNDYVFPLIFISSPGKKTLPLGMAFFIHLTAVEWGPLMAASVLISVPTMLLFLFTQRHLISGFGGAVKG